MDEIEELRQRIWERAQQRRKQLLTEQRDRYRKWMLYSGIFGALTVLITILTCSVAFGVVAAFFVFFTWNRWMEWRRVRVWLSNPFPEDPERRAVSVEELWQERLNPPNWERISNYIAIVTACLLFTFIEI